MSLTQIIAQMASREELIQLLQALEETAAENQRLRTALTVVYEWKLPETGRHWDSGEPMSYFACFGSHGVQEYMQSIAKQALFPEDKPTQML